MIIRIKFSYVSPDGFPDTLYRSGEAYNEDNTVAPRYTRYLAMAVRAGIPDLPGCEAVLEAIRDIEEGKILHSEKGDNDTLYEISKEQVQMSIIAFDDWSYQPEGIFTFDEFKKTVEGWHEFLLLPEAADSKVDVYLEVSEPDHSNIRFRKV